MHDDSEHAAPARATPWNANGPRIPGRIIFVGQIIPEKGLDLLLDAVALLRARGVDATLDVVGDIDGWESPAYRGHRAALRAARRAGRSRRAPCSFSAGARTCRR